MKDPFGFSWTTLFSVTAASFILFWIALKMMDSASRHGRLFLIVGITAALFAIVAWYRESRLRNNSNEE